VRNDRATLARIGCQGVAITADIRVIGIRYHRFRDGETATGKL
jgi:hypothetical protein